MSKRILLTGSGGFCGSHVLRHIMINTDWEVICPVTFRHRGNGDRIASAIEANPKWHDRIHIFLCDLSAPISDTTRIRFGQVDEIWNIASSSHVDRSITDPVPFIQNNVNLILYLLEYAKVVKPKLFLQMSTDEVMGPAPVGYNHKEWEPSLPSNPYSASKAAQEAVCISYWRTYEVPIIITCTMNLIGEMQDTEKFLPMIISKLTKGEPVPVHVSPEGASGSGFYLHARNLASAWMYLSQNHSPQMYPTFDRPSRFNIVGEKEVTNEGMVELVASALKVEPLMEKVNFHSSRPGHDLRYALDGSAIAKLGWKATVSLEDSIRKTVEWSLRHPEWLGERESDKK